MDKILAVIHREMLHARSKKVDEFREVNKNLNKCELLDSILKFVNFFVIARVQGVPINKRMMLRSRKAKGA